MSTVLFVGLCLRVVIIFVGFVAMWSLWEAREKRKDRWSPKMKDIWLCHILFIAASIEGNIEYLYREVMPSASIFLIGFVLIWSIKGAFNGSMYTLDGCEGPH